MNKQQHSHHLRTDSSQSHRFGGGVGGLQYFTAQISTLESAVVNSYMPNEISHRYQLEQSISV